MKDPFIEELQLAANKLHYEGTEPLGTIMKSAVGMYLSDWWREVPQWNDPGTVSGEINWK